MKSTSRKKFSMRRFLVIVAAFLRTGNSYVPRSKAAEAETEPTADLCFRMLLRGGTLPPITAADEATAVAAIDWVMDYDPDRAYRPNEYRATLREIVHRGEVGAGTAGYAASIISSMEKDRVRTAERENARSEVAAAEAEKDRGFVGTVGARLRGYRARLVKVFGPFSGYYGDSYLHKFEDVEDNIIAWFTSSNRMDEGAYYEFDATVKAHEPYNGVNQTKVNRLRVTRELGDLGYPPKDPAPEPTPRRTTFDGALAVPEDREPESAAVRVIFPSAQDIEEEDERFHDAAEAAADRAQTIRDEAEARRVMEAPENKGNSPAAGSLLELVDKLGG